MQIFEVGDYLVAKKVTEGSDELDYICDQIYKKVLIAFPDFQV